MDATRRHIATKDWMGAMIMKNTFPMLATTHMSIILFVTNIDSHGDGVEDYSVIDVGELCHLTPYDRFSTQVRRAILGLDHEIYVRKVC